MTESNTERTVRELLALGEQHYQRRIKIIKTRNVEPVDLNVTFDYANMRLMEDIYNDQVCGEDDPQEL